MTPLKGMRGDVAFPTQLTLFIFSLWFFELKKKN